ncbi:type ISP restriction/modification enzyme [Agromyces sp. H66]|uniref:DEAD/DEAH box helicase n=1 Tax=Agromyces sp. H66 TaxID=2529859 RepID=UPI0010AACFB1|nr:type ISP restriction/modification enzyme [Agromyces sp. H66]
MTSIHDILDELRSVAYDEHDKGARFEELIRAFLSIEPQYQDLYDEVWLWRDYPGRNGRVDTGIDLVARSRATGEHTAIQAKFYAPTTQVTKPMLDSFLAASSKLLAGKPEFTARLIVSTSDNWGKNAEDAVDSQNPPVSRLRVQDLDESSIDWSQFSLATPGDLTKKPHKTPFPHQEKAIGKVVAGFGEHDRGKLIMACGTGKTYTSLSIVERFVPAGGTVLFLVPSIALLSQSLKEWTIEANVPLRSFAVCSDVSVGKRKDEEDTPVVDLAYPATTNPLKLAAKFDVKPEDPDTVTVIFSTYQSIEVIHEAQDVGLPEFDLIICDEAHRTTGVTLAGEDESAFVRVHDQNYIRGKKRLYMTATPRIYADQSKTRAEEAGAILTDMNNEALYGPEFHRLSFGEAVSIGRLTDYKVLVLAVDESYVSKRFQRLLADENNELTLDDAAKIVGCWNGLSKRALTQDEFRLDPEPMKRAVAFARNIKESKHIAATFQQVVEREIELIDDEQDDADNLVMVEAEHVDGTYNVLARNAKLDWLKEDPGPGNARLLTNAKVLSEGVDVPALDAVMFLNPRDSVVDVVQSVGRVMRKLEGKNYGYVILPIGVPADVDPSSALNDNKKYKVVWQVLQALRAHDERFDAEVNKIDLTKKTDRLQVGVIGKGGSRQDRELTEAADYGAVTLDFPELDQWRAAILAKIVDKVGERRYWEQWASDVAGIAEDHIARITALVDQSDGKLRDEFARFLKGLQDNLNPFITERDAVEMLSQHLITKPVFDALFDGYDFSGHNPVSLVMQGMIDALEGQNIDKETERLEKFYASVRTRAEGIEDAAAKQSIVKELYEKFFRLAFSGTSDRLGIVYTPNEIVDFIIHSVDDALKAEFDASISDEGVHVLDPFTGTGTFIVRLLQSGLIKPEDVARKYRYELHANEIVLLAYYVAAINIEETYHSLAGGEYEPFNGIVLTDTFQLNEVDDQMDGAGVFPENNERVEAQKALDIRVVIGNPPWSIGQATANDDSANVSYPTLDAAIERTYAAKSAKVSLKALYDSYIRAIRWASDRIGDRGVVAFVSNGGWIDTNSADGIRKSLVEEFNRIYVFNLRGNQRTAGEQSRREGGKVFGGGSRSTVAVYLLVKNPDTEASGQVFYRDIGDYLSREQKLEEIRRARSYASVDWQPITPNRAGDWINQRSEDFESFTPLGEKGGGARGRRYFRTYSLGLATGRDAWVYGYSASRVRENVSRAIDFYNREVVRWDRRTAGSQIEPDKFVDTNPTRFSWNRNAFQDLEKSRKYTFNPDALVLAAQRPFSKQWLYFDRQMNAMTYQLNSLFPTGATSNFGIALLSPRPGTAFASLMVGEVPDLNMFTYTVQFFPRYSFEERKPQADLLDALDDDGTAHRRIDNITDEVLEDFKATFGAETSKDDIFYYLYGVLQSREFVEQFGSDLHKMLPRIPKLKDFAAFAEAGRKLAGLHLNYETVEPYPVTETIAAGADFKVTKMRYAKTGKITDKTSVIYNSGITISGIPEEAHEYMLGSRSAIDWIIERYQVKSDKASGITNDPNEWAEEQGNPRYILDLLARIVTVSVETVRIVNSLPPLTLAERPLQEAGEQAFSPERSSARWNELIGPFLARNDVARWINFSAKELDEAAQRGEMLALTTADGVVVYPRFQFDSEGRPLPRLSEVVSVLRRRLDEWGVALWLAQPSKTLHAPPAEFLREQSDSAFARVMDLATSSVGDQA